MKATIIFVVACVLMVSTPVTAFLHKYFTSEDKWQFNLCRLERKKNIRTDGCKYLALRAGKLYYKWANPPNWLLKRFCKKIKRKSSGGVLEFYDLTYHRGRIFIDQEKVAAREARLAAIKE